MTANGGGATKARCAFPVSITARPMTPGLRCRVGAVSVTTIRRGGRAWARRSTTRGCSPPTAIPLRANTDGSRLVLGDVARLEIGAQTTAFSVSSNGKGAAAAAVQMSPGANAVRTAEAIETRLAELRPALPEDMEVSISYNTAPFVKLSITKVIQTLIEAMVRAA